MLEYMSDRIPHKILKYIGQKDMPDRMLEKDVRVK